jgi:hypothetical protein
VYERLTWATGQVVTVLCAFEREVFDGWVASITKNISIKSRLKKVSSTRF